MNDGATMVPSKRAINADWKVRMLLKALKRIFKMGIALIEKIEQGQEV